MRKLIGILNILTGLLGFVKLLLPAIRLGDYSGNILFWTAVVISSTALIAGPILLIKPMMFNDKIYKFNLLILAASVSILFISLCFLLFTMLVGFGLGGAL